ncbi:Protein of unknown function [Propionibacterium freudenreichii]|nr:Protein of unknown function [Propionibacterium freudenreichii]
MAAMTSPAGEVLHIPAEGVAAMLALGWKVQHQEPVEPASPDGTKVPTSGRKRGQKVTRGR